VVALGAALVRARCLRIILEEEVQRQRKEGTLDPRRAGVNEMRVTPAMRLQALLVAYFSALHAVIAIWRSHHLENARVNELLSTPGRADQLAGFRDAMNHPRQVSDERIRAVSGKYKSLLGWADRMLEALEEHFEPLFEFARNRATEAGKGT
jgi:hypothetical protein